LRNLKRVRQPRAIVIAFMADEDLRLVFKAPEGNGVNDAIAIALEGRPGRAFAFIDEASARFFRAGPGKPTVFGLYRPFARLFMRRPLATRARPLSKRPSAAYFD